MKLPKGGFPGLPDDCDRPACDDTVSALNAALSRVQEAETAKEKAVAAVTSSPSKVECPPNSPELGRASWTLLHTMAAWYPDKPSEDDKLLMTNFMASLARFYPCTWCATDFQKNLEKSPVQISSRKDLCVWLCEQHNVVNRKIGKASYPCDMKTLDERWRKSTDPQCDSDH